MSFFNPFRSSQKAAQAKVNGQQGQPVELVNYDVTTGKFSLGHQALQVLREVCYPPRNSSLADPENSIHASPT